MTEALRQRLLRFLDDVEWADDESWRKCPSCGGTAWNPTPRTHLPGCELVALREELRALQLGTVTLYRVKCTCNGQPPGCDQCR